MNNLVRCNECSHTVSDTAIYCPACGKSDPLTVRHILATTFTTTAGLVLSPAAFVTGVLATFRAAKSWDPRRFARKMNAIDSFPLGEKNIVFVTHQEFINLDLHWDYYSVPGSGYSFWARESRFVVALGRPTNLLGHKRATVYMTHGDGDETSGETNKYVFKGNDASTRAGWAKRKLEEYAA